MTDRPELRYAAAVLGPSFVLGGSLGCSGAFARALGLPDVDVDLDVLPNNRTYLRVLGGSRVATVGYDETDRLDFWDCVVVLVALAHPAPPVELEACSTLVLAQGRVRVIPAEGSP